ncbi:hypothetical protein BJG93_31755 (plasmid) [Paraburkholderia sprentiae WSM5005]|uniref:Uncharacterized protein n=1 Tax=Paraburkholderia sprentiae WSM5005 TaxID=754502 RepID=A0A1I9YUW2_9BURK|nr:hypothetical protein [Paraburkholderia sprentiae]APA90002.1 hypothetical protein BJG93_31755 [Paraburkholderia sprentiae WSM5005]
MAESVPVCDRRASPSFQQAAIANSPANASQWSDAQFDPWLATVRFAYACLCLGQRAAGERAFEDGQSQARDYCNYAVQELAGVLFCATRSKPVPATWNRARSTPWAGPFICT